MNEDYPDLQTIGEEVHEAELDRALNDYRAIFADPALMKGPGQVDYDERERRINLLEDQYGPTMMGRVREELNLGDHPLVVKLREIQTTLRPYWKIADDVADAVFDHPKYSDDDKIILRRFIKAVDDNDPTMENYLRSRARLAGVDIISDYSSTVDLLRKQMRSTVPEIGRALLLADYSTKPTNIEEMGITADILQQSFGATP